MEAVKDPRKVRAGQAGSRARWAGHIPRALRMDELTQPQRELVLALIHAVKAADEKATPVIETPDVAQTDGNTSDEPSAA